MHVTKLHYSERLVGKAVKAFWWRITGWNFLAAMLLVLCAFLYSLFSGDRSWWVGMLGSVLILAIGFSIAVYVIHYRASFARFRRLRAAEAVLETGDDHFRIVSDAGAVEVPWATVSELWRFRDFWLLFLWPSQFITFPLEDLDKDVQKLILERLKSHGAKVV